MIQLNACDRFHAIISRSITSLEVLKSMFKKLGLYAAAIVLLSWIIIPQAQAEASNTFVTMSVGSKGPQVVDLQQRLRMLGYLSSEADGNYGEGTKDAVQRFQKGAAIAQTGVVGQTTMHALKK